MKYLIFFLIFILSVSSYFFITNKKVKFSFYDSDGNNYFLPIKNKTSFLFLFNARCVLNFDPIINKKNNEQFKEIFFIDWGSKSYEDFYQFKINQKIYFPLSYDFMSVLKNKFDVKNFFEVVKIDSDGYWQKVDFKLLNNDLGINPYFKKCDESDVNLNLSTEILFSKDIRPIFEKNCVGCHNLNHSFLNFLDPKNIVSYSSSISKVLITFAMPPWNTNPPNNIFFENSKYLSIADRKKVLSWISEGSRVDSFEPLKHNGPLYYDGLFSIGEVDFSFSTSEVELPANFESGGLYKVLIIDPKLKEDIWVESLEVLPKNKNVVHHVLVHIAKDNENANEAIMKDFVGSYLPGQNPFQLKSGYGKKISKGSRFVLVVHYTPTGKVEVDQISIGIQVSKSVGSIKNTFAKQIYRENFIIPANTKIDFEAEHTIEEDIELLKICPHGHFRANSFELKYRLPNTTTDQTIIFVPNFKYQWQFIYNLVVPISFPKGTTFKCRASYDNTILNQSNPNPYIDVDFGLYSSDEMMACYIYYAKAK